MREMRTATSIRFSLIAAAILTNASVTLANNSPMRITDVRFASLDDPTQIEVVGARFDNGASPDVMLDGRPITVHGFSATLIRAEVPANVSDGDHSIAVSTGPGAKQNAEHGLTVAPLVAMSVTCIDWFITAGHGEHIHNELHVEDEYGDPILGAEVVWTSSKDGVAYQTNVSATTKTDGHNDGGNCTDPTGSGVTGWFCCIGAGKFDADGQIPGKRSCPAGEYSVQILAVSPPPGTTLVWDGESPGRETVYFDPDQP